MAIIERNRVFRPSTRDAASTYKVDCKKVTRNDELIINITHETEQSLHYQYTIDGSEISEKNSIHFEAAEINGKWKITWQGDKIPRQIR